MPCSDKAGTIPSVALITLPIALAIEGGREGGREGGKERGTLLQNPAGGQRLSVYHSLLLHTSIFIIIDNIFYKEIYEDYIFNCF